MRIEGKIVMIEDRNGGYKAFMDNEPAILAEGETILEARKNLASAHYDIIMNANKKIFDLNERKT